MRRCAPPCTILIGSRQNQFSLALRNDNDKHVCARLKHVRLRRQHPHDSWGVAHTTMQVARYQGGPPGYRHYAGAAVGGLYNQAARHLFKTAIRTLRDAFNRGPPFPTRAQLEQHSREVMKRGRYHAPGGANAAPRKGRYIPYGYKLNRRTGGFVSRPELKFYDTNNSISTAGAGRYTLWAAQQAISCPPQGVGANQRTGRNYHIKSVMINGVVNAGYSDDGTAPMMDMTATVYIVLDTQCNKVNLAAADTNCDLVAEDSNTKPRLNLENSDRFRILAQKRIFIGHNSENVRAPNAGANFQFWGGVPGTAGPGPAERAFQIYKKVSIPVQCDIGNPVGGAEAVMNNAIYVMVHLNSRSVLASALNAPKITCNTRIRFCC